MLSARLAHSCAPALHDVVVPRSSQRSKLAGGPANLSATGALGPKLTLLGVVLALVAPADHRCCAWYARNARNSSMSCASMVARLVTTPRRLSVTITRSRPLPREAQSRFVVATGVVVVASGVPSRSPHLGDPVPSSHGPSSSDKPSSSAPCGEPTSTIGPRPIACPRLAVAPGATVLRGAGPVTRLNGPLCTHPRTARSGRPHRGPLVRSGLDEVAGPATGALAPGVAPCDEPPPPAGSYESVAIMRPGCRPRLTAMAPPCKESSSGSKGPQYDHQVTFEWVP